MSTKMQVKPRIRGFVCITAHPDGCSAHVAEQITKARADAPLKSAPRKVLVLGASTGYGLASRITTAFGGGADTLGVFFERPSDKGRPASAGWYNTVAFHAAAAKAGLYAKSLNGDAFSDALRAETVATIRKDLGQVDMVIYSIASPRREDPATGAVYKSVLKPVGTEFTAKSVDTDKQIIEDVTLEPATPEELEATRKVMGGEDLKLWLDALRQGDALADSARTLAYSYIGPDVTYPIYRHGTIGKAKEDLEAAVDALRRDGLDVRVSVNKAVVTQASSAIPVVPLYISLLFRIMKEKGLHEDCIEQTQRLFTEKLTRPDGPEVDDRGRIRLDDWEMREDVQDAVKQVWPELNTATLGSHTDFAGYQENFLKLFGFGLPGVDYTAETELERHW